jgi:urate oxidase
MAVAKFWADAKCSYVAWERFARQTSTILKYQKAVSIRNMLYGAINRSWG